MVPESKGSTIKAKYCIDQLRTVIGGLQRPTPLSDQLPLQPGQESNKLQWLRRLEEYLEPGFYNRKTFVDDARHAYQHLGNARMIVWLNEAAGEDTRLVSAAMIAAQDRDNKQAEARYACSTLGRLGQTFVRAMSERVGGMSGLRLLAKCFGKDAYPVRRTLCAPESRLPRQISDDACLVHLHARLGIWWRITVTVHPTPKSFVHCRRNSPNGLRGNHCE